MIDWSARAGALFSQTTATPTDKADETPLSSVSSVPDGPICENARAEDAANDAALLAGEADDADDAEHEAFEERAAIMQFDGGLSRADAETEARACTACEFQSRRKTCLEPVAAGLADHFSIRFTEQVPGAGAGCAAYRGKS